MNTQEHFTIIPAVDFYTAAALEEGPYVGIRGGGPIYLVPLQVGIVGGVDEVVGEGLGHVLGRREERISKTCNSLQSVVNHTTNFTNPKALIEGYSEVEIAKALIEGYSEVEIAKALIEGYSEVH